MKKFITAMVLAFVTVASTSAMAGRTDEGTWATGFDFSYDSSSLSGSETTLDLELGYFIFKDNLLGGTMGYEHNDWIDSYSIGAKYEFYFDFGSAFVPYVGAGLKLVHTDWDRFDDNTALAGELSLGVKFFITEAVAVDMAFSAEAATDDVYIDDNNRLDSNKYDFTVGLDLYF
ncbi:MAG: hypothetical protein J6V41_01240 [Kiritimatiellae bacterium]|nr:hypothetical protein [Kiritimatiellia bacterium]